MSTSYSYKLDNLKCLGGARAIAQQLRALVKASKLEFKLLTPKGCKKKIWLSVLVTLALMGQRLVDHRSSLASQHSPNIELQIQRESLSLKKGTIEGDT